MEENIFISSHRVKDLINKWNLTMSNGDRKSDNRTILHTRLSEQELVEIDRAVYRNRELTGPQLNARFRLRPGVYGGYATVWLSGLGSITKRPSLS